MKQLWLKEWREQFKVALMGLAGMTLVLWQAVRAGIGQLEGLFHGNTVGADGLQPLISGDLLVEGAIGCGVFGLVLGWLQIHSESHRDLRAFLLHRPVERLLVLHSKLLCGLGLYTLAVGLPFTGLLVWVLIPGHVPAPFEWAMVEPLSAVFLLGFTTYGAGMLAGLRPARWYGSRIFGLGPAILAAIAVFAAREYGQALAALLATGGLLYLAIRGAFLTGGAYEDQSWPAKLGLSLTCAMAGILLTALGMAVVANFLRGTAAASYKYAYYTLTAAGQVYRVGLNGEVLDLDHHPLINPKTGQPVKRGEFNKTLAETRRTDVVFEKPTPDQDRRLSHYNSSARYFIPWRVNDKTLWYWLPDGRLASYDGGSRRFTGYLAPPNPSEHFWVPENYYQTYFQPNPQSQVLVSRKTVYRVDLEARTVTPGFTTTNEDGIGGFADGHTGGNMMVVTREAIRLLDDKGGVEVTLPYQPGWPQYSTIQAYWLTGTNGYVVAFSPDERMNKQAGGRLSIQLIRVNPAGQITRTQTLPQLPKAVVADNVGDACALIFPPAVRMTIEWFADQEVPNYWDALSAIPALLCVGAGWWQGRRYHFSGGAQAGWAVFHAVFGIPGLIAFFSVQEWPAREVCPPCGQLRRVDREQCDSCGGAFAPPALKGTEIFAELMGKG